MDVSVRRIETDYDALGRAIRFRKSKGRVARGDWKVKGVILI